MTSIIIPAHNEENVIDDALRSVLNSTLQPNEIIVVCNGCTDETANHVRRFDGNVKLLETPIASKIHALNLGDSIATGFPRVYMDADVRLSTDALEKMTEVLSDKCLATSPRVKMDCVGASWFVRAYYDIWLALPYCNLGMIGAGIYALSKEGRLRFGEFPDIIADDGYVRALFNESERTVTNNCYITVSSPKTLGGLIKIKTRSRIGGYELNKKYPELIENEEKDYASALFSWTFQFKNWFKILVYFFVNFYTKYRAKQILKKGIFSWERDETSRHR